MAHFVLSFVRRDDLGLWPLKLDMVRRVTFPLRNIYAEIEHSTSICSWVILVISLSYGVGLFRIWAWWRIAILTLVLFIVKRISWNIWNLCTKFEVYRVLCSWVINAFSKNDHKNANLAVILSMQIIKPKFSKFGLGTEIVEFSILAYSSDIKKSGSQLLLKNAP